MGTGPGSGLAARFVPGSHAKCAGRTSAEGGKKSEIRNVRVAQKSPKTVRPHSRRRAAKMVTLVGRGVHTTPKLLKFLLEASYTI